MCIEAGFWLSLYNYKQNQAMIFYDLWWRYVFKGHVKIVKIYMAKFNVSILNRLKIMVFL